MADLTIEQFAVRVLHGIGAPITKQNVRAMVGWSKAEGGHFNNKARYNPLNTTQPMAGAGNTGSQGNIKVYKSWDQGIQATVKTIKNGHYGPIISALHRGSSAEAVAVAIGHTPWGTMGGLVQRVIAATPTPKHIPDVADVQGPVSGHQTPRPGTGTPMVGQAPQAAQTPGAPVIDKQARLQAALSFLDKPKGDPLAFATDISNIKAQEAAAGQDPLGTVEPGIEPLSAIKPYSGKVAGTSRTVSPRGGVKRGRVIVDPGANRAGVHLQHGINSFLGELAGRASNSRIEVGTGTNHNRMTLSGNVSDHWDGNASDLKVGGDARQAPRAGQAGDKIAAHAIALAGGIPFSKALALARKGGVFNYQTPRGRVQILWRTMTGGNHFDHVHIGVNPKR